MIPGHLIVILGPTTSGKSALGVRLAKKFDGVVISADSRQVYRGLDIGTAKITKKDMRGVPHYLLDVASPQGQYSVSRYVKDVARVLIKIPASTPVFLVGGSPFYIKAITEPGSFSSIPPNTELRRRLERKTTRQLIVILRQKNPERLKTTDPANRRRLIRAIEISMATPVAAPLGRGGRSAGGGTRGVFEGGRPKAGGVKNIQILKLGLSFPRHELYKRIDRRVDARLPKLIAEVRHLHRQGLSWRRLESFGLEYRWTSRFLRGLITKPEMVARLKGDSHDFARRQLTWWRKEADIHWISSDTKAARLTQKFLQS